MVRRFELAAAAAAAAAGGGGGWILYSKAEPPNFVYICFLCEMILLKLYHDTFHA